MTYAMSIRYLSEWGWSARFSHLRMSQNTRAVQNDEKAYTSPSTAENQNVSLHVYASAPQRPDPKMTSILTRGISVASSLTMRRLTRCVTVQKSRSMVAAESNADMMLTISATLDMSPKAKLTKNLAASMKIGLPGGWPTSSL